MTLKQIKMFLSGVLQGWFSNKPTLDKLSEQNGKLLYNGELLRDTDYDTEEKIIGKWIDGRPVYRKVIQCTTTSTLDTIENIFTLPETINLIKLDGIMLSNTNRDTICEIPLQHSYSQDGIVYYVRVYYRQFSNTIAMETNMPLVLNIPVTIILEYTKSE